MTRRPPPRRKTDLAALDWRPVTIGLGSAVALVAHGCRQDGVVTAIVLPGEPPLCFQRTGWSAETRYVVTMGRPTQSRRRLLRPSQLVVVSR